MEFVTSFTVAAQQIVGRERRPKSSDK